jgi:hypothetical protein
VRLSAFAAAFLLPLAVAALPLLTIFVGDSASSATEDLALSDVPVEAAPVAVSQDAPMAYGAADTHSSLDCAGESIVAIEG